MKYFILNGGIEHRNTRVEELMHLISNEPGNITIALDSSGGNMAVGLFLLDMLNDNAHRIHLVALSFIESMALTMWLGFKGYKSSYPCSSGTAHQSYLNVSINENHEISGNNYNKTTIGEARKIFEKYVEPNLTKKELQGYHNGEDVIITPVRLVQIANKHNRLNKVKRPEEI